ncbi:hypothetical protein Tco_0702202 [Tanacetum coccineum]|uniref:Uncharacterized protein n=1 Tax=Tanacetum coccineum TaxID=301880 RepID=A0ABQ4XWX3_9ASTR
MRWIRMSSGQANVLKFNKNHGTSIQEKDNVIRDLKVLSLIVNDNVDGAYMLTMSLDLLELNARLERIEKGAQLEGNLKVAIEVLSKTNGLSPPGLREIGSGNARVVNSLDNALNYACQYTKLFWN